jgi:hypothetical protein
VIILVVCRGSRFSPFEAFTSPQNPWAHKKQLAFEMHKKEFDFSIQSSIFEEKLGLDPYPFHIL